jgi:outer membrane protein OmpA-like peptidoglycan-associated protein
MKRIAPPLLCVASLAVLAACSDRAPGAQGDEAATTTPASETTPAAASTLAPPVAEAPVAAAPAPLPPSDPDHPLPLPALQFTGAGTGVAESRYFAFDAGAGTITVTATAKNSPSGATQALQFALYDRQANRLCFDSHGNTTSDKTVVLTCTIDKAQPLLLRLDLSAESLDHAIALAGPVTLPAPVAAGAAEAIAGAGSTDIDEPTRLSTNRVKADGTGKPVSYYYAFNAGPGELTLTGDGRNTSAALTEALRLGLYTLRSERLCELTLGNTTLDKRAVTTCVVDKRQPVILRADLSAETVFFRARFDGPFDFEPYTPPAVVTIALDSSVLFDTGKSELKPEARDELHEAAERIRKFAGAAVLVSGHTDDVGSDAANQALSEQRAAAVKDHFVRVEGIAADALATKGFGSTQPVADNGTEAGRARNRRVDVVIDPRKR